MLALGLSMAMLGHGKVARLRRVCTLALFKGSHLTLIQLLDIVYYWAKQMKQSEVCNETGICCRVVIDWHNFLQDMLSVPARSSSTDGGGR